MTYEYMVLIVFILLIPLTIFAMWDTIKEIIKHWKHGKMDNKKKGE